MMQRRGPALFSSRTAIALVVIAALSLTYMLIMHTYLPSPSSDPNEHPTSRSSTSQSASTSPPDPNLMREQIRSLKKDVIRLQKEISDLRATQEEETSSSSAASPSLALPKSKSTSKKKELTPLQLDSYERLDFLQQQLEETKREIQLQKTRMSSLSKLVNSLSNSLEAMQKEDKRPQKPVDEVVTENSNNDDDDDDDDDGTILLTGKKKTEPSSDSMLSEEQRRRKEGDKPGVFLYAFATHAGFEFCRMMRSALMYGNSDNSYDKIMKSIRILGWGQKLTATGMKIPTMLNELKDVHRDSIAMFVDGFDVLFASSMPNIIKQFLDMKVEVLFGAELGCYPLITNPDGEHICNDLYPESPTKYRYLNSGMWIGYVRTVRRVLQAAADAFQDPGVWTTQDQRALSTVYLSKNFTRTELALDHSCRIFQNVHLASEGDLVLMRETSQTWWRNTVTGTRPLVFHFNGGAKKKLEVFDDAAWYTDLMERRRRGLGNVANNLRTATVLLDKDQGEAMFGDLCPSTV